MKKLYNRMTVTPIEVQVENPILGSSPIEIQSDVRVNDFGDGNTLFLGEGYDGDDPFVISFD